MLSPANIQKMADAGVQWGRLFFYKGFGIEYERPAMEQSKKVAEQMHKLGMKVSLYMGGTMFTETLYRELPEAKGWEQRDQWDGRFLTVRRPTDITRARMSRSIGSI